ncbi:peptidase associated/transthyretin-like domain-containing protein [Calditrichota bacterium LG25]
MKRFFLIAILFLFGCLGDAPRDNPLENQNGLTLEGSVHTFYAPHLPLEMVPVQLKKLNLLTYSDAQGRFEFTHLKPDSYTVIVGGQNFSKDSVRIFLKRNTSLTFKIDRLPQFLEIKITTHHQARWFPVEDAYFVQVYLRATDPDGIGDLSLAYYDVPGLGVRDTLLPGADAGEFYAWQTPGEFNVQHVNQLIGKAFEMVVEDDAGFGKRSEPVFLTRIIEQTVQLISPVGLQTIFGDTIRFQWQSVYLTFPFHYKLEIFQINNGVISIVKTMDGLPSDQTELELINSLPAGDYLWRIYLVDEFGNTSSSKEGAFQIP